MQLLFVLMAASSASAFECACRGVRGEGAGWAELCALGTGGNITAEYIYELEVRPGVRGNLNMQQALKRMDKEQGEEAAAAALAGLRARAQLKQEEEGGLYKGSNSGRRWQRVSALNPMRHRCWEARPGKRVLGVLADDEHACGSSPDRTPSDRSDFQRIDRQRLGCQHRTQRPIPYS